MIAQPPVQLQPESVATITVILVTAVFTENILLTRFLGMCPFLSVSRQLRSAVGMGLAVVVTLTGTVYLNALLYWHVLVPLEPYGVPAESLKLILFIIVIAAFVQFMEMLIERVSLKLYYALGIFLPLITVNCAILGGSLFMVTKRISGLDALLYGFGTGVGWMLAIVLLGGIRERLKKSRIPAALEGRGISLIIAGIMALAFIIFQGMVKV
jgi:Na+-transporting NADH:ubiquinone oxidoreductase subunit E